MKCYYCSRDATDSLQTKDNVTNLCKTHARILKTPELAVPFLRGYISQKIRGTMPQGQAERYMEGFLSMISSWKPGNPGN
jgi:hypothetical protein